MNAQNKSNDIRDQIMSIILIITLLQNILHFRLNLNLKILKQMTIGLRVAFVSRTKNEKTQTLFELLLEWVTRDSTLQRSFVHCIEFFFFYQSDFLFVFFLIIIIFLQNNWVQGYIQKYYHKAASESLKQSENNNWDFYHIYVEYLDNHWYSILCVTKQ